MSNSALKNKVLNCFKNLHKTRKIVFSGDKNALILSRNKINEEFKKNKGVTDKQAVEELIKYSKEVENELRTSVIQAKEVEPGKYRVQIRAETTKLDNVPFKNNPCISKTT